MYILHGFFTQNSMKPLYVLEELGVDYEFRFVDLAQSENRTDSFREMTPVAKVPVLEHNGEFLFESGPICRYVTSLEKSPLIEAFTSSPKTRRSNFQWACPLARGRTKMRPWPSVMSSS